ncbi:hypothetical protein K9L16_00095 [Candidatus Pacearchaeota archaeon]|nr:hypothetical protein [Candidatus Pacearchaeota archaeon]
MNREYEFIMMAREQAMWKAERDARAGIYDDHDVLHPAASITYQIAHNRYCREHPDEERPLIMPSSWREKMLGGFDEED